MRRNALAIYLKKLLIASIPAVTLTACPIQGHSGDGGCGQKFATFVPLDGGYQGDGGLDDGGLLPANVCQALCGAEAAIFEGCQPGKNDAGANGVSCDYTRGCVGGRRPAGLAAARAVRGGSLGQHFARMAHLEAASVAAFRRLRDELAAHGAPRALIEAAERAERDELRHARATGALARRHGATPPRAVIEPVAPRSLEEIALENAVEGCVGETWGALVALHQAGAASDSAVRRAMAAIAEDESQHAELAWEVAAWASRRLEPAARARVDGARRDAGVRLLAQVGAEPADRDLIDRAGLPAPARAAALAAELTRTLWS